MRQALTTTVELVGMAAIALGCTLIAVPFGLIVGGALLMLIGYLAAR